MKDAGERETNGLNFVRLLHELATEPRKTLGHKCVDLDGIDILSLLAAASWNVNFMILTRFLADLEFERPHGGYHAARIATPIPLVVLVCEFVKRRPSARHAYLVFAEYGRYRATGAFLADAAAVVRAGGVLTYPVVALDDRELAGSSLYTAMKPKSSA